MKKFSDFIINEEKKKCVPYGSDVSSENYKCVDCGYK